MLLANAGFSNFGKVLSAKGAKSAWYAELDPYNKNRNIYSPIEPNVTFTIKTFYEPSELVKMFNEYNDGASISYVEFGGIVDATPDGTFKKPKPKIN
jgi:hypothetical protein